MRVLEAFETSEKLVNEGRLCEIEFQGEVICEVQLRPADPLLNSDYRKTLADLSVDLPKPNGAGEPAITPEKDTEMLYRLYARSVIIGWSWTSPADQKDAKLKFNERNAVALFKRAPKFFEAIQVAARRWSHFRAAHEEAAKGN